MPPGNLHLGKQENSQFLPSWMVPVSAGGEDISTHFEEHWWESIGIVWSLSGWGCIFFVHLEGVLFLQE